MTSQPHDLGAGEVIIDGKLHGWTGRPCPNCQGSGEGPYLLPENDKDTKHADKHICSVPLNVEHGNRPAKVAGGVRT